MYDTSSILLFPIYPFISYLFQIQKWTIVFDEEYVVS